MVRTTANSRSAASNDQETPRPEPRRPESRPRNSRHVSFAQEQDNVAEQARQKKEEEKKRQAEEKRRKAQEKANATAIRNAIKEQESTAKRRQKEDERHRKKQEAYVARLEEEVKGLQQEKELEQRRIEAQRQLDEDIKAMQRRDRQTTDELVDETELSREAYSPRTLQTMKRDEAKKNGPYDYAVGAVLKSVNGSTTTTKWSNKIGGIWKKGGFNINVLNVDLDAAMEQYGIIEWINIKGWVKSTASRGTRQYFTLQTLSIEEWELRVESIATQEWQKFTGHVLDVELVCTGRY